MTAKKMMVVRRRLGKGTALKRLYVPLDLASTFMPPLPPFCDNEKSAREGDKGREEEEEAGDGEGSGGACGGAAAAAATAADAGVAAPTGTAAGAAAGSNAANSSISINSAASGSSRMILTFVAVASECQRRFSGCLDIEPSCSEYVMTTHEVEYERRHFGNQVHYRLTKGWRSLCLILGASVGDILEMRRCHEGSDRGNFRGEDGESEGIKDRCDAKKNGSASGESSSPIFVRIVN